MYHFCTYFDANYLSRALALHASLMEHGAEFRLYALCMDEDSFIQLRGLQMPRITIIQLGEVERFDPELAATKTSRSRIEYFYTAGPAFVRYLMARYPEIDLLTYLDADLYFFAHPSPIFAEIAEASVAIIEHRFPPRLKKMVKFGRYNVGWVSFRRDDEGLKSLAWWRERCIEWCYDRLEGGRFADQKYLDDFPARFARVHQIEHPGANLAPWNLAAHIISVRGDRVFVDNHPLIFFHFHGLRRLAPWLYDSNVGWYKTVLSAVSRNRIFRPYIRELKKFSVPQGSSSAREQNRRFTPLRKIYRHTVRNCCALAAAAYVIETQ